MLTLRALREHANDLQAFTAGLSEQDDQANALTLLAESAGSLADELLELLDEPTNVQALALAARMRNLANAERPEHRHVRIVVGPFDLPEGYWLCTFGDGFTCGIAPDGSVSS